MHIPISVIVSSVLAAGTWGANKALPVLHRDRQEAKVLKVMDSRCPKIESLGEHPDAEVLIRWDQSCAPLLKYLNSKADAATGLTPKP